LSAEAWAWEGGGRLPLAVPRMVEPKDAGAHGLGAFALTPVGRLSGHGWEQIELRAQLKDRFLVNLCNTAPVHRETQLVVIHDAAVFRFPRAYSAQFRLVYRAMLPDIAQKSRRLLTISEFSASELMTYLGVSARAIDILPNAGDHILRVTPDAAILETHGLEAGRYLFAVGNANPTKNHALLQHIEPLLKEHALPLVLAGGALPAIFGRGTDVVSPWFKRVGFVSDNALRALYEHAKGFIFPSLYEGCGVPPLEAMHCGCPVIAARAAAIPETCGEAALYFDPTDAASLIAACRRLIESPSLGAELRAAGHERTRRFSWKASSQRLAAIITEAVAAG
jgi:glycosyltransferase involved in cell wall biosynthesis